MPAPHLIQRPCFFHASELATSQCFPTSAAALLFSDYDRYYSYFSLPQTARPYGSAKCIRLYCCIKNVILKWLMTSPTTPTPLPYHTTAQIAVAQETLRNMHTSHVETVATFKKMLETQVRPSLRHLLNLVL